MSHKPFAIDNRVNNKLINNMIVFLLRNLPLVFAIASVFVRTCKILRLPINTVNEFLSLSKAHMLSRWPSNDIMPAGAIDQAPSHTNASLHINV